jgi:hypothetical protein
MMKSMGTRIPSDVLAAMRAIARKTGALGGRTAAKNMTAEERSARAKKASMAAAEKRTAKRLSAERAQKPAKKNP